MNEPAPGLRERTRRVVQGELASAALELFLTQGFEETTVGQIADAAGLSRRSFFRYFASKDDVLAHALSATGESFAAKLAARPPDEAPWAALRHAFEVLVEHLAAEPQALQLTRAILESPAPRGGQQPRQSSWRQSIAAALVPRLGTELGEDQRRLQADALAGAALACLNSALADWVAREGKDSLADLLDVAMNAVAVAGD